jgi:hypothetical protein
MLGTAACPANMAATWPDIALSMARSGLLLVCG